MYMYLALYTHSARMSQENTHKLMGLIWGFDTRHYTLEQCTWFLLL